MKGQNAQKAVQETKSTQREWILDRPIPGPQGHEEESVAGTGEDDQ